MLAEFIDRISSLARMGYGVETLTCDELPETVFVRVGDKVESVPVPPPRRAARLDSLDDLIEAAQDAQLAPRPAIYHTAARIVLQLDREDGRDVFTLTPDLSERFRTLDALRASRRFSVRQLVRFLRLELHGTGVGSVIRAVQRIDFERRSGTSASSAHGAESLGRSVEARVQQADEVPEEFDVRVAVYRNPGLARLSDDVDIRVGLYLDLEDEQIELRVLSDQVENAVRTVHARIGAHLREALPDVPIYHGTP